MRGENRRRETVMGVRGAMNLRGGAPHFVLRVFEPDRFYLSETLGLLLSNRRTGRQLGEWARAAL